MADTFRVRRNKLCVKCRGLTPYSYMKILIADDDKLSVELLSEHLKESNYTVITTYDGEELIKTALTEKPDLIITDIHMPKLKGDTTIAMMEHYRELQNIPVIVLTATPEHEIYSLGLPFDVPVILKPVDFAKLLAEVKKIEDRQQRTDSRQQITENR